MGSSTESGGNNELPHVEGIGRKTREASMYGIDALERVIDDAAPTTLYVLVNSAPEIRDAPPIVDQQPQPQPNQAQVTPYAAPASETVSYPAVAPASEAMTDADAFQGIVANYSQTATNAPAIEMTTSDVAGHAAVVSNEQSGAAFAREPQQQATYYGNQTMDELRAAVYNAHEGYMNELDELENV